VVSGCRIVFPDGEERAAQRVASRLGPLRSAAAAWLGVEQAGNPVVYLESNLVRFGRRAPGAPAWAAAVVRSDDTMVFNLARVDRTPAASLELVLAHEVVHQVLNHLGGVRLPRWFEEGLCESFAGVPFLPNNRSIPRMAAGGSLPSFAEIEEGFSGDGVDASVSYKAADSAVGYFLQRFSNTALRELLARVRAGATFGEAFRHATGLALDDFEAAWRADVTPPVPLLVYILFENIELTLLALGGFLAAAGYLRWRLRRERAMRSLEMDGSFDE